MQLVHRATVLEVQLVKPAFADHASLPNGLDAAILVGADTRNAHLRGSLCTAYAADANDGSRSHVGVVMRSRGQVTCRLVIHVRGHVQEGSVGNIDGSLVLG